MMAQMLMDCTTNFKSPNTLQSVRTVRILRNIRMICTVCIFHTICTIHSHHDFFEKNLDKNLLFHFFMIFIYKAEKTMYIDELRKSMGIRSVLRDKKFVQHPQNDSDMCYVEGITQPMQYKEIKARGITDDRIQSFQPYVEWLEDRNAYLEEEARIRREKDSIKLPF